MEKAYRIFLRQGEETCNYVVFAPLPDDFSLGDTVNSPAGGTWVVYKIELIEAMRIGN